MKKLLLIVFLFTCFGCKDEIEIYNAYFDQTHDSCLIYQQKAAENIGKDSALFYIGKAKAYYDMETIILNKINFIQK